MAPSRRIPFAFVLLEGPLEFPVGLLWAFEAVFESLKRAALAAAHAEYRIDGVTFGPTLVARARPDCLPGLRRGGYGGQSRCGSPLDARGCRAAPSSRTTWTIGVGDSPKNGSQQPSRKDAG